MSCPESRLKLICSQIPDLIFPSEFELTFGQNEEENIENPREIIEF